MGRIMRRIGTGSATQRIELGGTYDAEVEDIELTVNSEYFSSINYTCQKYGRLVVLTITGVTWVKAITTGGVVVLSGLPAPSKNFNCALMAMKSEVSTSSPKRMRLLTNGNLASWYESIATDENPYGIITYLSAN